MPRLTDDNLQSHALTTNHFGFSAQRIDDLGAVEYTLATLVVDDSSSIFSFRDDMIQCVKNAIQACQRPPRADFLMLRVLTFANEPKEYHGFKLLSEIKLTDYDVLLGQGGRTALYDASENAIAATAAYGKQLIQHDYSVNGIVIVITDGIDCASISTSHAVKTALGAAMSTECLESIKTILVGVNTAKQDVNKALQDFKTQADFDQYIEISKADSTSLAQLADWMSQNVKSQSQSLGTGGPSKNLPLNLTF